MTTAADIETRLKQAVINACQEGYIIERFRLTPAAFRELYSGIHILFKRTPDYATISQMRGIVGEYMRIPIEVTDDPLENDIEIWQHLRRSYL